jgi:hypothetical protein
MRGVSSVVVLARREALRSQRAPRTAWMTSVVITCAEARAWRGGVSAGGDACTLRVSGCAPLAALMWRAAPRRRRRQPALAAVQRGAYA